MSTTTIAFSELLGRRVRLGSWQDQKVSTYRETQEAIGQGRWYEAARLAAYFVDEANVCFTLYRQWIADISGFLVDRGVPAEEVERVNAEIVAKLALPDGSAWHPRRRWDLFLTRVEELLGLVHRERAEDALAKLDEAKEAWRQVHDRDVDHIYGLMHEVKARLGEDAIRDMYDRVLLPLFAWRYEKFDIDQHPWDEALEVLLLVACEAMRGHLAGPDRTGDFELVESDDRFILRFDPCGSGQRTIRGDWIEGTPARMGQPYNWSVTEEPHTWNHGTPGVCHYCCHCIILMEEMPIDRFGYPVRVIDPPVYPDLDPDPQRRQKCQWQMFKDPTQVPAEYYERVGRSKPAAFGSKAQGAQPLPDVRAGLPGTG